MERNEFDMINNAINEKMNKKIKELKQIYQATKNGGDSDSFHKLCDGISNTLVLYKSAGNRRFGVLLLNVGIQKEKEFLIKIVFYFH